MQHECRFDWSFTFAPCFDYSALSIALPLEVTWVGFIFVCFVFSCWDVNPLTQFWTPKTLENIFTSFPLMVWESSRCNFAKSWQAVTSRFRRMSSMWSFYHESLMCVALQHIVTFSKVLKISEEHSFSV